MDDKRKIRIMLDDEVAFRMLPSEWGTPLRGNNWGHALHPNDIISAMCAEDIEVEEVTLDHDLGPPPQDLNGMDFIKWLEYQFIQNPEFLKKIMPEVIGVHSMNTPAHENMVGHLLSLQKAADEQGIRFIVRED